MTFHLRILKRIDHDIILEISFVNNRDTRRVVEVLEVNREGNRWTTILSDLASHVVHGVLDLETNWIEESDVLADVGALDVEFGLLGVLQCFTHVGKEASLNRVKELERAGGSKRAHCTSGAFQTQVLVEVGGVGLAIGADFKGDCAAVLSIRAARFASRAAAFVDSRGDIVTNDMATEGAGFTLELLTKQLEHRAIKRL